MSSPKRILILHGWTNRRQAGVWHRILASNLRRAGHQVIYPQFPNTDNPVLAEWQELLEAELGHLAEAGDGETVVIAHSLGCINWMQAAVTNLVSEPVDRLLLVAPADPKLLGDVPGVELDLRKKRVVEAVKASARSLTLVASDADTWIPDGIVETFGRHLEIDPIVMPGAAHISLKDGWGHWQGVIDWVNDPSADITVR